MRKSHITCLLVFPLFASLGLAWISFHEKKYPYREPITTKNVGKRNTKLGSKITEARTYVATSGLNTEFCFLVDMETSSGQSRFFVMDMGKDSVIHSGLVTHGRCNEDWLEGRRYSNSIGSGCTSLGRYKIGARYYGRFGLAFKLYGLDSSNSNAFRRFVVLHSHECVPEAPIDDEICQSDGCPTVSPRFLNVLDTLIKGSKKPILLWIFD